MKTAFNDFFYEKRGIYGVLHVMILLVSLFLIVDVSIDTFNNIPFITQTSYLKTQFWICMFFIADFVLEFLLSKHKLHYLQTHIIFLLVSIPYLNIIDYYGFTFSAEVTYFLRFIPLVRSVQYCCDRVLRISFPTSLSHSVSAVQEYRSGWRIHSREVR